MKQGYRTKVGQPEKITPPKICACIFFGCLFMGVLAANLGLSDEALWVGFVNENNIRQFSAEQRDLGEFIEFALRSRLIPWIIIVVCGIFFWGSAVCGLWFGWIGFSGGFLLAALIQRHGIRGILLMGGMGFPQYIIYAAAYIILLKLISIFQREKKKANSKKNVGIYILFSVFISVVFCLGILTEYYINPLILAKSNNFF